MKDVFKRSVFVFLFVTIASLYSYSGTRYGILDVNSFTGASTYCQDAAASNLSIVFNTCTYSGSGSGGTTFTITWYYNVTNSTNIGTATQVSQTTNVNTGAGATSGPFTYTPSTTTPGTYYYFVVLSDPTASCGFNPTLSSGTQLVTVNAAPTPVTVSGGGSYCGGSATLNASGGTGGTIYWQNTTSNGTSTATPSTSEIVGSSGTYYFRARSAGGCWGTQGSALVTFNPLPTITLGSNPSVCQGTTTANLTYSATTGSPNQYSINYDATAEGQGFVDVSNAALPASPIVLVVPAGANTGTYNYTVTVTNSATGCTSSGYAKTVTVNASPTITTQPTNQSACVSVNANFTVATSAGSPTYQWQMSSDGAAFVNVANGTPAGVTYSGATTATLTANGSLEVALYYYRCVVTASGCFRNSNTATLNINNGPAAAGTISGSSAVCRNDNNVAYSVPPITGATSYIWSYTGTGMSFSGPTASITANFSGAATSGNLTVYGTSSCGNGTVSANFPITVSSSAPSAPGSITGLSSVCLGQAGVSYAITPVAGAASYNWSYSGTGATINGTGSSVTVDFSPTATSGNLTVRAVNGCGSSSSSPALAITPTACVPHSSCNGCHMDHDYAAYGTAAGNALLCMSCHKSGGTAAAFTFVEADKAIPGTSGTSHAWAKDAVNATYETSTPVDAEMALRIYSSQIVCSTCHDTHSNAAASPFLRVDNTGDAICKDCHSARNVGRYTDNPALNKGSHPVGLDYSGTGSLKATPTGTVQLVNNKIECSSCHKVHYSATNDGYILRSANDNTLCTSCHSFGNHQGMGCLVCHETHNTNKANIYMIRNTVTTPSSGDKTVNFTALTGANSFADGDGTYDGICEVCHTNNTKTYHYNNAAGDHNHNKATNCTDCHVHSENFTAPDCSSCHDAIPAYLTDAHAVHVTRYGYPCKTCHYTYGFGGLNEPIHGSGTANVNFDPAGLAKRFGLDANTPAWNSGAKTCSNVYCHSTGNTADRGTDGVDTWGAAYPGNMVYHPTPSWATGTITSCGSETSTDANGCHNGPPYLSTAPYKITRPGPTLAMSVNYPTSGKHQSAAHESNSQNFSAAPYLSPFWATTQCFWCHDPDGVSIDNDKTQGTYGTAFHADGQTYFKPRWYMNGGTMANWLSYSSEPDPPAVNAQHCGAGKTCW